MIAEPAGMSTRWARVAAFLAAAIPFAFALVRAIRTGNDLRYFWVGLGSLAGGIAAAAAARRLSAASLAASVFVAATLGAVLAALLLGTKLGLGILVVAAGFGFCYAVAAVLARWPR